MSGWTTIRDVEAAVIDCLGGVRGIQAWGGDVSHVRAVARQAWREVGPGRFEDATREDSLAVIGRACDLLAATGE